MVKLIVGVTGFFAKFPESLKVTISSVGMNCLLVGFIGRFKLELVVLKRREQIPSSCRVDMKMTKTMEMSLSIRAMGEEINHLESRSLIKS